MVSKNSISPVVLVLIRFVDFELNIFLIGVHILKYVVAFFFFQICGCLLTGICEGSYCISKESE